MTATDDAGYQTTGTDEVSYLVDNQAPAVTGANITVTTSGTGADSSFVVGDVVTATWDAAADGNTDIDGVTVDFSAFGGSSAEAATLVNGVWTASHTIVSGSIDVANASVSVTATDDAGYQTTGTDDRAYSIDTVLPTLLSFQAASESIVAAGQSVRINLQFSEVVGDLTTSMFDSQDGIFTIGSDSDGQYLNFKPYTDAGTTASIKFIGPVSDAAGNQASFDRTVVVGTQTLSEALEEAGVVSAKINGDTHYYGYAGSSMTLDDARDKAIATGGHLATSNSAKENNKIKEVLDNHNEFYAWLDATREIQDDIWGFWSSGAESDLNGNRKFVFDTVGSGAKYANWNLDEPNNNPGPGLTGEEDALSMARDGGWNDTLSSGNPEAGQVIFELETLAQFEYFAETYKGWLLD